MSSKRPDPDYPDEILESMFLFDFGELVQDEEESMLSEAWDLLTEAASHVEDPELLRRINTFLKEVENG